MQISVNVLLLLQLHSTPTFARASVAQRHAKFNVHLLFTLQ